MKEKKSFLKSNKGISIMELLLVMVISLLILVFLLISYNVVNNANVTKASKRLENVFKNAKVAAMSRGQDAGMVNITVENGRVFATTGSGTNAKKELICNANVILSVGSGGVPPVIGTASAGAIVAFNPSGRIRTSVTTGDYFILSKGSKRYKIIVYKETGAIECGLYNPGAEATPTPGA